MIEARDEGQYERKEGTMIASLLQDVRYALRRLRKSLGFTLTAVTVLALGLGANIAVFTLIEGILLRPLPYVRPDRSVAVDGPINNGFRMELNYANFRQLSDAAGSTVRMGMVLQESPATVAGPGGWLQVKDTEVTANLIDLLDVHPLLGRGFRAEENDPGRNRVVLLSEAAWRKLYNGDPGVVGKSITLRSKPYTIVGVMPKGFTFPFSDEVQVWSPAAIDPASKTAVTGDHQLFGEIFARLPQGMNPEQLSANLNRAQAVIAREAPDGGPASALTVTNYQRELNESARKPLGLLYAVAAGVWALACLNVTSLMLARSVSRTREQAVRSALGASRARLLQQAIVESLLLSGMGSVLGLLGGQAAIKLLWHQIERSLPLTSAVHVEWRVIAGLAALTLITA